MQKMNSMVRKPVVAGQFYPGSPAALRDTVAALLTGRASGTPDAQEDAIGVVSPHAGYPYSGSVAAEVFRSIRPKGTYIILGPNHSGMGGPFGISRATAWKTPLGETAVHTELADALIKRSRYVRYDDLPHAREHSIEVQLPFVQYLDPACRFVPMVIADAPLDMYRAVGMDIASAIRALGLTGKVTIIASSDMTHYESRASAKKKDAFAIDAIIRLDEAELVAQVSRHEITMCGYAPTAIMLAAAKELGASHARLIAYRTSGDATGDYSSVVAYAGFIIT